MPTSSEKPSWSPPQLTLTIFCPVIAPFNEARGSPFSPAQARKTSLIKFIDLYHTAKVTRPSSCPQHSFGGRRGSSYPTAPSGPAVGDSPGPLLHAHHTQVPEDSSLFFFQAGLPMFTHCSVTACSDWDCHSHQGHFLNTGLMQGPGQRHELDSGVPALGPPISPAMCVGLPTGICHLPGQGLSKTISVAPLALSTQKRCSKINDG